MGRRDNSTLTPEGAMPSLSAVLLPEKEGNHPNSSCFSSLLLYNVIFSFDFFVFCNEMYVNLLVRGPNR